MIDEWWLLYIFLYQFRLILQTEMLTFVSMKSLSDSLRKTLAHRHMGNQMVGAVVLNTVNNFLLKGQGTRNKDQGVEGYVRFKKLFLKSEDQALKIKIFQQKNQILHEVNLALEKVGYATRVEEIRIKT